MRKAFLDILRCPYCAMPFRVKDDSTLETRGEDVVHGILACACASYPVLDGIPYVSAGGDGEWTAEALQEGDQERALFGALQLDDARYDEFRELRARPEELTFSRAIDYVGPDDEGKYLVYRFSDPTFRCTRAVLRSLGQHPQPASSWMLDMCGGSGHLSRALGTIPNHGPVVLADVSFWKLWLAREYVSPEADVICCDGDVPLPFAPGLFSMAACSDAYHYIWQKRLLAGEMMRLVGDEGTVVIAHTHNSLCENFSPGMPLPPAAYRNLFAERNPRLYRESEILEALLAGQGVDLSRGYSDAELADERALTLIASPRADLFREYRPTEEIVEGRPLHLNPHYVSAGESRWQRTYPSESYEAEYVASHRYLPAELELSPERLRQAAAGVLDADLRELAHRHVLLDLPERYA